MAANTEVKLQWRLPSGGVLFSTLAKTNAKGSFTAKMQVRPANAAQGGEPSQLVAEAIRFRLAGFGPARR